MCYAPFSEVNIKNVISSLKLAMEIHNELQGKFMNENLDN